MQKDTRASFLEPETQSRFSSNVCKAYRYIVPPAALKRHTRVHKTGKRWIVYTNLNNSHVDVVLLYGMYTWNDEKQGNGFIPFCFLCTELYLTLNWNKTTSVYFRHTLLTLLQTSLVCTREVCVLLEKIFYISYVP